MTRLFPENRRKRIQKSERSIRRLLDPLSNRRVHCDESGAIVRPDWRKVLRIIGKSIWITVESTAVILIFLGLGVATYFGYQRVLAAGTFDIKHIHFRGVDHFSSSELANISANLQGPIFDADLDRLERDIIGHPWVEKVEAQRTLPDTVTIDIKQHVARAALVMGSIYLVNDEGTVFKQAELSEAETLPMITGFERNELMNQPDEVSRRIQRGLAALELYERKQRPAVGEVHVPESGTISFFLEEGGVAIHFGNAITEKRLDQLDHVWTELGADRAKLRALFLDSQNRNDRVVARMSDG